MESDACAFTGHRPSKLPWKDNEDDTGCVQLKQLLRTEISGLIEAGTTNFLSGMALGTDIWCAELVLTFREINSKVKLHCILPCREQPDKWATEDQLRYLDVLQQADSIVYVNREFKKNCMLERNRFLVEHSSKLLAVYNGEYRGGTAATVRYAEKLRREISIINPRTLQLSRSVLR
ncbi:MAG: DUF1273 domain-containing protein [Roseburia sp.]|nr:DUF1273 domain-containing protein [Lachnospiraceae bacterium]MCM1568862.1 DUF1273 domain-containing protein [Roseburia sp.]